jgi:hypothetical protein
VTPGVSAQVLSSTSYAGKMGTLIITTAGNAGYFFLARTADIGTSSSRIALANGVTINMGNVDPADLSCITGSNPPYCSWVYILD